MKRQVSIGTTVALCALTGVALFNIGFVGSQYAYRMTLPDYAKNRALYAKLGEIAEIVEENYVGSYDKSAVNDWAAIGYVSGINDKWSSYVPASKAEKYTMNSEGQTVGVGIEYTYRDGMSGMHIYDVLNGSSAQEAGIQKGDWIIGVEGRMLANEGYEKLSELFAGDKGTKLAITVRHPSGESEKYSLERRLLSQKMAFGQMLDQTTGSIVIRNFHVGAAEQFNDALSDLVEQGAQNLIIDVRQNGGGRIKEMAQMLDRLLPEKDIIICRDKNGNEISRETSDAAMVDLPIVVLADSGSISAAEFFAGVLQEYGRAVIVGEQTSGKGRAQTTHILSDGSALILSTQTYYTPAGKSLETTGVKPDVKVLLPSEKLQNFYFLSSDQDDQLQAALQQLSQ